MSTNCGFAVQNRWLWIGRAFALTFLFLSLDGAQSAATARSDTIIAQKIIAAWRAWAKKHRAWQTSIAVSRDGKVIATDGIDRDASDPYPIASLSKAITAVCTAKLVNEYGLSFQHPLKRVLNSYFAKHGSPADRRYLNITLAHLLTHSSGMGKDITQSELSDVGDFDKPQMHELFQREAKYRLKWSPGQRFHYNNVNYVVLGMVIEERSRRNYETYCKEMVFDPIGVTDVDIDREWRILSAFGGWRVSAANYSAFLNAYFGGNRITDQSPASLPTAGSGGGSYYSLGTLVRVIGNGRFNFWHFGDWKYYTDLGLVQFGSYFAMYGNGVGVSINYSKSVSDQVRSELDAVVYRAAH